MSNFRLLLLTLLLNAPSSFSATILHCDWLIDGYTSNIRKDVSVVIENGSLAQIKDGFLPAESRSDEVIALKDATCMPGLMDMHVHITSQTNPRRFENQFRYNPADYAYQSVGYARKTLLAGFTTVRDLGSSYNLAISMRNSINKGYIIGPRIVAAGKSLATTGGHADPTNGRNTELQNDPGPREGVVNSIEDAKKAVRQRYKDGADMIKITATGGVLSQAANGLNPQFTEAEIRAIVDLAKDYGFKVAAHAHGAEGMKRAIRAGVASIEHGTYMDKETMRLMKKYGTTYVPTIIAGKFVAEKAEEEGYFSELVRPKARTIGPLIQETFAQAYKAGVKIVFGTDTGVSAHGDNWKEFIYMVEAGMPAMEAIQSATGKAARLIDMEDKLGTIQKGKIADIIAVQGNPLEDIRQMEKVVLVIKEGTIYKQP